ncbi:hypothetical protein Mapa_006895 [Marchantia paleacea]|nr:hypothetical protein Mapa_006895 [Marchantia paleacea]
MKCSGTWLASERVSEPSLQYFMQTSEIASIEVTLLPFPFHYFLLSVHGIGHRTATVVEIEVVLFLRRGLQIQFGKLAQDLAFFCLSVVEVQVIEYSEFFLFGFI